MKDWKKHKEMEFKKEWARISMISRESFTERKNSFFGRLIQKLYGIPDYLKEGTLSYKYNKTLAHLFFGAGYHAGFDFVCNKLTRRKK